MIQDFIDEYQRYKVLGQKSLVQIPDEGLNRVFGKDNNSIAVIVSHISGNLISRFTDFLGSDGEKPWRNRDAEFADREYAREEIEKMWNEGWRVLEGELAKLTDAHLNENVVIRGQSLTVHAALSRSLAHTAYHVGQIVIVARMLVDGDWKWLTIPKGTSTDYNRNPTMEKKPQ